MMVGLVALAAPTIFPLGCWAKRKSHEKGTNMQHLSAAHVKQVSQYLWRAKHGMKAVMPMLELAQEARDSTGTCKKFCLAAMKASWVAGAVQLGPASLHALNQH